MKKIAMLVALCLMLSLSLTGCVKVVEIGHEDELTGNVKFNAADDVEKMWTEKAVPELKENAVPLDTFLKEAGTDLKSVAGKYGKYSMGDKGELSYIVKGEGTVKEVNQEKKAGYMLITPDGYDGQIAVKLQIGSVYKGSAVRDCLSFIKYEDYTNQVDWAKISQSIHDVVDKDVVQPANPAGLVGKKVAFTGCFTVDKLTEILITPVELEVK